MNIEGEWISCQPDASWCFQTHASYIQGWLAGAPGTDSDLFLDPRNGYTWVEVAGSTSVGPRERIVYNGQGDAYYRFRVYQFSGVASSVDLWANHPKYPTADKQ